MKFKEFVIQSIAKEVKKNITENIENIHNNSILLYFAVEQFNIKSGLDARMLVTDCNEKLEKLSDLLTSLSKPKKIELLMKVATFVDYLAEHNRFFYIIPIDEMYISENNTILFNWFDFSNYCIQDQFQIPKPIQLKYGKLFDRNVNSGVIPFKMLSADLSKNSFIKFMMQSLYPKVSSENMISIKDWINVAITKLGFTPEEKNFIVSLITDNKEFNNCQAIMEHYQLILKKSIVNVPQSINKLKWSCGFHTEQGQNKKSNQNEDAYEIIKTPDEESILFMVADGVSTANIGRGKIVSSRIQEYLADKEEKIKEFMDSISLLNHQGWVVEVKKEIASILTLLNINITEELNIRIKDSSATYPDLQPMSSTVILGMINNNRCVFGYLGDSHVFYTDSKNMLKLTEDHNVLSERVSEYLNQDNKQPFISTKRDKHLTKTFPLVEYDENEKIYYAIELDSELTYFEFYPTATAEIIVSTDGLLDSIGTTSNEIISEQELFKIVQKVKLNSKDLTELARNVGRQADNNSGIDNITLLVLTNQQVQQPKNSPKVEKKMIEIT